MRLILALIGIFFCAGCHEEVKYEPDLAGIWEFQTDLVSGEFEIVRDFGNTYYLLSGSEFKVEGKTFINMADQKLTAAGFSLYPSLDFNDQANPNPTTNHFLSFEEITFDDTYTTLTSKRHHYRACDCSDTKMIAETTTITKK